MIKCRQCGVEGHNAKGVVLQRMNEKGVEGIWECRPICGAQLSPDVGIVAAIEGTFEYGTLLSDCIDVELLRDAAAQLWGMLDDIDTVGDAVKSDDAAYRKRVERIQRQRFDIFTSDGYKLFLSNGSQDCAVTTKEPE